MSGKHVYVLVARCEARMGMARRLDRFDLDRLGDKCNRLDEGMDVKANLWNRYVWE